MGLYTVHFDDYCLGHYDEFTYFNYFEFDGKKYPIGAHVNLTKSAAFHMLAGRGYNFIRGNFRIVDHYVTDKGIEEWEYIIGRTHQSNIPLFHTTTKKPDELIEAVLCSEFNADKGTPGELEVAFKEFEYDPQDWEVEGLISGWITFIVVFIASFFFKDWFIRMSIQVIAGFYFGSWRENKINEAISKQKFIK